MQWKRHADFSVALPEYERLSQRVFQLLEGCDVSDLRQHVTEPTRGANFLDLVFSKCARVTATVRDGVFDSDHKEIVCRFVVPMAPRPPTVARATALNYKRADFDGLRRAMDLVPWTLMENLPMNDALDVFYELFEAAIRDHVPTVVLRRRFPPWFDTSVRQALREKETAFNRTKRNRTDNSVRNFEEKRKRFKTLACSKYRDYIKGLIGDFQSNPKRFWTFLKCIKGSKGQLPVLIDGRREVSGDLDRANLLNRTFAAKFARGTSVRFPGAPVYDLPILDKLTVSETAIRSALRDLQVHKACGPDNVSARIIKECSEQLVRPLFILFNMSVSQGIFPTRWAEANIVPIFKKGSRKSPDNYRAVSLLPILGKILERSVYDTLFRHVQPALTDKQHGFVPHRSCETNLATLLKTAWESISEGDQTDVIYTDYSAAFQSVSHELLLYKLRHSYHISDKALYWLTSFLSNRKQRVVVNGKCSDWTAVLSGTPEGSLLSPLLFALFVNDLPNKISTNCLLFADDVKLYHKIKTPDDASRLQNDLNTLCQWSSDWRLQLNPQKCKSFTMSLRRNQILAAYKINDIALERVSFIKDLGIWLDTKLTFGKHIDFAVSKANRAMGIMIRSLQTGTDRGSLNCKPVLTAYFGNVRSVLEYGCVIWGGASKTHLERLDRIQHKFLIWLACFKNTSRLSHSLEYKDLLRSFNVTSLEHRRLQYDILFVYKIHSGQVDCPFLLQSLPLNVPTRLTRSAPNTVFHVPFARVETVKRGVFVRASRAINEFLSTCQVDVFHDGPRVIRSAVVSFARRL